MSKVLALWTNSYVPAVLDRVLARFDVLVENFDDEYERIDVREILLVKDKAIQVRVVAHQEELVHWFPISQLKVDSHAELYCKKWLLEKDGLS